MHITRRAFLKSGAMAGLVPFAPKTLLAQEGVPPELAARKAMLQLGPDGFPQTEIWGYNGTAPGPELRMGQGSVFQTRLLNELDEPTSVHWHGLRIDNAMDGVTGLTQDGVAPGDGFDYSFTAPDAGTFWYHAHARSFEQVGRGLYGAFIVDEAERPDIDRDEVLILDDWRLNPESGQIAGPFAGTHDRSHAGRLGNFITTNSAANYTSNVKKGERLRLRLINAANDRIFSLAVAGFDGWIMAYDGMPLTNPEKLEGPLYLAPGQRVDLFVDVTADEGENAFLARIEDKQGFAQATFPVTGSAARTPRAAPAPLPPNPNMSVGDLQSATPIQLKMEGGAMGSLKTAVLDGKSMDMEQIANANQFWAFNGVVGLTDTPLARLSRNETARMTIVNDTAFAHAMHLHGMHFREVLADGTLGPLRDTLLIFSGQTRDIAFLAHNPGKWLFHCHMLAHAASGMTTWVDVA